MPFRSIQISLDEKLLKEIDRQTLAKRKGRSAFIRGVMRAYFEELRRREIDAAYARGYGGKADEVLAEFRELIDAQAWPKE